MKKQEMISLILAGGRGTRLESLTKKNAKPAVYYGGKYRIIDFPLSNCSNSNINVVGILTQYESVLLNNYTSTGSIWGFDRRDSGIFILPPREKDNKDLAVYKGTADAITQNIDFIDSQDPEYVLILSGDHIYKMDYEKMLDFHKEKNADCTIAVYEVDLSEASRFGIMNTNDDNSIYEFEEKPVNPKSNLASMGIYIFNWKMLKEYLLVDELLDTFHDFGKNIIPNYLEDERKMFAYEFNGYWKDVGTIKSLWEANMDLLDENNNLNLSDQSWKIYSSDQPLLPQFISSEARVSNSLINQGSIVRGQVNNSVIFHNVVIEKDAFVDSCVVLPNTIIKSGAILRNLVVSENMIIDQTCDFTDNEEVTLLDNDLLLKITNKVEEINIEEVTSNIQVIDNNNLSEEVA